MLRNAHEVLNRVSGKDRGSLGLHPAIYFYTETGKYSRYLFLGMVALIQEKLRNNNSGWFKCFTSVRPAVEKFLLQNKSIIGMVVVNLNKTTRVDKLRDLINWLVDEFSNQREVTIELAIASLGLTGRILDVRAIKTSGNIDDDTRAAVYLKAALPNAMLCPICQGVLDPNKSATYDHIQRLREGGTGDLDNVQMVYPYCNTGYKN